MLSSVPKNPWLLSLLIGQEWEQFCQWRNQILRGTRPAGHRASCLLHCLVVPQEQEGSQGPCRKLTWVQPPWRRELGSTSSQCIAQATRSVCSTVTGIQFFSSCHRGQLRDSEKGNSSAYTQAKFAYVKPHLLWWKSKNRGSTESHASRLQLRKLLLPIILPQSQRIIWLNWAETSGCKVSSYAVSSLRDLSGHFTSLSFHTSKI